MMMTRTIMTSPLPLNPGRFEQIIEEDCELIREICSVDSPEDKRIWDELRETYGELEWLTFNIPKKRTRINNYLSTINS